MLSVNKGVLNNSVIKSLVARVREESRRDNCNCLRRGHISYHTLPFITCAAALAHHGLLDSLDCIRLGDDVDLSTVPTEHLISLVSRVTQCVQIVDIRGCDLVTLLDSLVCYKLRINSSWLISEEILQALGRAMKTPWLKSIQYANQDQVDMQSIWRRLEVIEK